jgi:hypothetical protein
VPNQREFHSRGISSAHFQTPSNDLSPNPGEPAPNFERAFRAQSEGVPLEGHFIGSFPDTVKHMAYNNHAPLHAALAEVRAKLGEEEAKSYHLAFPRSIAYFIDGLFIAFMSWVVQKGSGRIVVDPSTPLDKTDRGALNAHIPKPGLPGSLDRNPHITYANAFVRHLIHLWNLRISNPRQEILQHTDDIEAAFHRINYHPDLGVCYAYMFEEFLIIPVSMIFGSGDLPSWFGATAEPRTHMGATRDYTSAHLPVVDSVQLPPPPTEAEITGFVQATADAERQGISAEFALRFWHAMFVDDNAVADIYDRFTTAVRRLSVRQLRTARH